MMDGRRNGGRLVRESHESAPDNPVLGLLYGQALTMNGQQDEAITVFDQLSERFDDQFFGSLARFYSDCIQSDAASASESATSSLLEASQSDPQWSWCIAQCYALLGFDDHSIKGSYAIRMASGSIHYWRRRVYSAAALREHERYQSLMAELHNKWMYLET